MIKLLKSSIQFYKNTELKNAIIYYIIRKRERRKVPKLKDRIQSSIEKNKKANEDRRRKKENFSLEIKSNNEFMDPEQTAQVMNAGRKIKNLIYENA